MDKSQEEYIINAFKEIYDDFPIGKIIHSDCPDFIVESGNQTIGIEITQIFIDSHLETKLNEKRKESLRCRLGDSLCKKLAPIVPFKFLLHINYSAKDFSDRQIIQIVSACEDYIRQIDFSFLHSNSIRIDNFGQLPEEIDQIGFFKYQSIEESSYVETAGNVAPDLTNEHLTAILTKKNKTLKNYKICNTYWLLIEEGTFCSDGFDKITITEFQCDFEKVFLYRHSRREIIELK